MGGSGRQRRGVLITRAPSRCAHPSWQAGRATALPARSSTHLPSHPPLTRHLQADQVAVGQQQVRLLGVQAQRKLLRSRAVDEREEGWEGVWRRREGSHERAGGRARVAAERAAQEAAAHDSAAQALALARCATPSECAKRVWVAPGYTSSAAADGEGVEGESVKEGGHAVAARQKRRGQTTNERNMPLVIPAHPSCPAASGSAGAGTRACP